MISWPVQESVMGWFWQWAGHAKNTLIGTLSVGLLLGALYFAYYLLRLTQLPKKSREYRELSYHLESETLVRYSITFACLIILNILIYGFFEAGPTCIGIGVVVWGCYLGVAQLINLVRSK
jgi:uncharacterized membrane protein (DUF485 family)